jgi:hypothetical protein
MVALPLAIVIILAIKNSQKVVHKTRSITALFSPQQAIGISGAMTL